MIQETRGSAHPDDASLEAPARLDALQRLPQPLYLLEFAAGTQHYHFGCFERAGESLQRAQDRMSTWGVRHFAPRARVLDIGCGLGGTSQLLAGLDLCMTGLDPCREALDYARGRSRGDRTNGQPRFVHRSLEEHARTAPGTADGAIAIEVLQHFSDLEAFFAGCRALLRPGGILVLHDVALEARVDLAEIPFHPLARVLSAADRAGFGLLEQADLSSTILCTLPSLAHALEALRQELVEAFHTRHPVEHELDQLLGHMQALQAAFERGELSYRTMALQAGPPRSLSCE